MAITPAARLAPPVVAGIHETAARKLHSKVVAVIGAGAAGLVAAREMRREGHRVIVFQQGNAIGGTWVYSAEGDSGDHLGLDPRRKIARSSLYQSLRTNLPREAMGFLDYPFTERPGRDGRRFPAHPEVLAYLQEFAEHFDLLSLIRFHADVFHVERVSGGRWIVRWRNPLEDHDVVKDASEVFDAVVVCNGHFTEPNVAELPDVFHVERVSGGRWIVRWRNPLEDHDVVKDASEVFDAVVVCNGHFTEPNVAELPGVERWPGKQIHSHNYRVPEPFRNKVVVLIGSSASAVDISRDIAPVAKEVHVASRSESGQTPRKQPGHDNMWIHSMIKSTHEDGTVVFKDETSVWQMSLCIAQEMNDIVTVNDNRVGTLYKHVFPPSLAPSLSFIGIPWKVAPFAMFEFQCKWVAGVLSERISLPSEQEMLEDVEAFYSQLEANGVPTRYTHSMTDYQFEYDDWLATQSGCQKVEEWRKEMYSATSENRVAHPEAYRDEWDADHLVAQAREHFFSLQKLKL